MDSSYFNEVRLDDIGIHGTPCSVEASCSAEDTGDPSRSTADRVNIGVPYSNTVFRLQMLLSADSPSLAPDFIFDDPTFLSTCDAAELERHLPALRDWRGPSDLPTLLHQLLTAYKAHVTSRLPPGGSLLEDYSRLLTELGPDALEPMVAAGDPRPVLFVTVRLPLDFDTLWERVPGRRPPRALLVLKATEKGGVQARLKLSPALAALAADCRLPPPAGRSLPEYVSLVTRLTERQLREAADGRRARRLLLAALAAAAPQRLLDFTADCSRVVLSWDGAVAELLLSAYPRRSPTLCLASTAGHWRREVPVPLPEGAGVAEAVTAVFSKVEELLKGVDQEDDSEESLI